MKTILVIDIPDDYIGSVIDVKLYGKGKTVHEKYVNKLKLMPMRSVWENDFSDGWNACLAEITGETE